MALTGNRDYFNSGGTPSRFHYASCYGYAANGREYEIISPYEMVQLLMTFLMLRLLQRFSQFPVRVLL
ncbi:MAG: hypothetical protein R2942_19330 [Ignavibacteria bacterium]